MNFLIDLLEGFLQFFFTIYDFFLKIVTRESDTGGRYWQRNPEWSDHLYVWVILLCILFGGILGASLADGHKFFQVMLCFVGGMFGGLVFAYIMRLLSIVMEWVGILCCVGAVVYLIYLLFSEGIPFLWNLSF